MERFSERQRIELALIVALGLFLLYALLVAPFFAAERVAADAERAAAEALLARVEMHGQLLRAEPLAEKKLRARQGFLMEAMPEEQGRFIRTVERLARQNNVVLVHFAPQPPVQMEEFDVRSTEIKMRGNYFDVLSFFHALQEAEPGIRFGDFSITADGEALDIVVHIETASRAVKAQNSDGI
mgnify:FL=1